MEEKPIFDWIFKGAFFLLIVLVPLFFSFQLTTYTLPKVVIAQILVSVLLASWLLKMTIKGRFSFERSMLASPIFIYFVISISSLTFALSVPGGIRLLWQVFAYVMVYFIVFHHIREEKIETWVFIISLVGIMVSGYGTLQYFGFEPLLKGYYYTPYIPISTLGHRNQAAQYLILLIPLSGVFFVLSRSRARRLIFGFSTLLMIYHLFLTKSRGAFVGFILSFLFVAVIMIYKWLARYPSFYQKKRVVLILLIFFPFLLIFIFFIFPTTRTLRVKHVNPAGYYIHSIDGSKIPANQPIRIEFDFRILKGSPEKPGYVNLLGERTNSSPIYLDQDKGGWNHLKREDIYFSSTPYDEDLKLRWVPGSENATLQLRNITVRSKDGLNLIKDSFLNRLFSKMGVAEIDKTFSGQARLYIYRNTIEMIKANLFLGSGFGNFKYVYPRYRDRGEWALSGLNTRVEEAHNEYLQILSEVGIIGFLAFAWILLMIGRMSFWIIQNGDFDRHSFIALALTMGILATLVQSLFDFNLQNPASGVTFWVAIGFLEIIYHSAKKTKSQVTDSPIVFSIRSKMLRGLIGFGIFAGLATGIFFSARPAIADYYLKWARLQMEYKDWKSTLWSLKRASAFSPYHFDVYFHLGQTREQLKDYEGAVKDYQRCIALHPYFIEARNNLGAVYIKLDRLDEAVEEFKGAIEINPYHPGLHNNLGYLYSKRNLLKKAIEEYQKVLDLDSENAEVCKNLGLLYFNKLKDYPKAQEYWERYLILNPGDPQNGSIRNKIEEMKRGL
ncbi:MAG: tetratricopeptide repeat protein [Thermodesulfobacteriota bacterium]|jgi:tetratricopeptide (TPR) repeat protein